MCTQYHYIAVKCHWTFRTLLHTGLLAVYNNINGKIIHECSRHCK